MLTDEQIEGAAPAKYEAAYWFTKGAKWAESAAIAELEAKLAQRVPDRLWPTYEAAISDPIFQQARGIMGTQTFGQDDALRRAILHVLSAAPAAPEQQDIPPEMAEVLNKNLWDLYADGTAPLTKEEIEEAESDRALPKASNAQQEWLHLKGYGYAPGNYMNKCHRCEKVVHWVDKRATTCRPCAEAMYSDANAQQAEPRNAHFGGNSYEASMLRNLLARIHGDGGHYVALHGLEKSMEDADQLCAKWRAQQAEAQEPVYQYQRGDGSWIDQTKDSHEYNVRHGQANVRMLFTRPQPAQLQRLSEEEVMQHNPGPKAFFDGQWKEIVEGIQSALAAKNGVNLK